MQITCTHCFGTGLVPLSRTKIAFCEPCDTKGVVDFEPTPPFSIDAMLGDDEFDTRIQFRCVESNIPSFREACRRLEDLVQHADLSLLAWDLLLSDANGNRLKKVAVSPVPTRRRVEA